MGLLLLILSRVVIVFKQWYNNFAVVLVDPFILGRNIDAWFI